MEKLFEDLKQLLDNPDTSWETKEAVKKMIEDQKSRHVRLANELDQILKR